MFRRHPKIMGMALAGCLLLPDGPAKAHPHAWIDVTVEVLFDGASRVKGLRETWLFDEDYTVFATEGFDRNHDGKPDPDKLAALLRENMRNLEEYRYFTRVKNDGVDVSYGKIREMSSHMAGNRLEMTFVLPLAEPVDAASHVLIYAIYDPTYYIEMLHAGGRKGIRLINAREGCRGELGQPDPAPEAVSLAAALDRTQSAGDGLGALFAEEVIVRCDAP